MSQITKQRIIERTRELLQDCYPLLIAAQLEAAKQQPDIEKLNTILQDMVDPFCDASDLVGDFVRLNKHLSRPNEATTAVTGMVATDSMVVEGVANPPKLEPHKHHNLCNVGCKL
jgi:hypothetical protein